MPHSNRKTAPAVRNGQVQKKNRHDPTPSYWNSRSKELVFDRERPGQGYRYLLTTQEVIDFVLLLPQWERLSQGLDAILLARGGGADGWYMDGVIGVCAWKRPIEVDWHISYFEDHHSVLQRLDVPATVRGDVVTCGFTEKTAKAFQLLHVLMHELGHHWDRMNTRSKRGTARGEGFAESYALEHEPLIWDRYSRAFKL